MRKSLLLLAVFFVTATNVKAQIPFHKEGFEDCWVEMKNYTAGKQDYWDLKSDYFLSTLNLLHELEGDLGDAPLTAYPEKSDYYNGNTSLKLVSKNMTFGGTIFLPGVAATLSITISPMDCILGRPFTSRPTAITGWHKYIPVNGDTSTIEVFLKKGGSKIGHGKLVSNEVPTWSNFNIPISYSTDETPDTIVVIFAASGNYDFTSLETLMQCEGQVGSTLYMDEVEFEYGGVGVKEMFDPEIKLNVYPNPSTERVRLKIGKEVSGNVVIYDYLIRKIGEYPINGAEIEIDIKNYPAGSYLINVEEAGKVITTNRFVKQ